MAIRQYIKEHVSTEGFFDRFGKGKPKVDPYAPSKSIQALKDTYLNKDWLEKQKLASGEVTLSKSPSFVNVGDVDKSWANLVKGFTATQQENRKRLLEFDQQLKPYKDNYKSSLKDSIESTRLLKAVTRLKVPEFAELEYPRDSAGLVAPALNAAGIRRVAETVISILKQKTDYEDKVGPVLDQLISDWVGVNATYRKEAEHDSDADLIAREIAGWVEELDDVYRGSSVVVEELLNDARTELINHLMLWLDRSVK
jgi:hypothetical protein